MDKATKQDILDTIANCPKEDFDGHTEFHRLSPKERLLWLSNTAYFVYKAASNNPKLNSNRYFKI